MSPIIDSSGGEDVNCSDVIESHTTDEERTVPGLSTVELSTRLVLDIQGPRLTLRSPLSRLTISVLVEHCRYEITRCHRGEQQSGAHCLELLRHASLDNDQDAWQAMQQCLEQTVLRWLNRHPAREEACRLKTEEYYVTQTFERFSKAMVQQQLGFRTLADALLCLRVYLNSAIVDALRAPSRSQEMHNPRYLQLAESEAMSSKQSDVWGMLRTLLPDGREQRLAFLFFHCILSPAEIVISYPQEFSDVRAICRVRYSIIQQVIRRMDRLE